MVTPYFMVKIQNWFERRELMFKCFFIEIKRILVRAHVFNSSESSGLNVFTCGLFGSHVITYNLSDPENHLIPTVGLHSLCNLLKDSLKIVLFRPVMPMA